MTPTSAKDKSWISLFTGRRAPEILVEQEYAVHTWLEGEGSRICWITEKVSSSQHTYPVISSLINIQHIWRQFPAKSPDNSADLLLNIKGMDSLFLLTKIKSYILGLGAWWTLWSSKTSDFWVLLFLLYYFIIIRSMIIIRNTLSLWYRQS